MSVIQPLVQKALNMMETIVCWERKAAKRAQIVGLRGEKWRLHYLSREAQNIIDWLNYFSYDMLRIDFPIQLGTADVTNLICCMSTMNGIIEKLWAIHKQLRKLVNEFVAAEFKEFSDPFDCYAEKIFCIISELQNANSEYEKADYEYHHISRYQISYYNVRDEYKKKEETQGYESYHGD